MGTGVQEIKHAAKLQEWTAKVAECRGSGRGVKAWCTEHGIALKTYYSCERQIVKEANEKYALPAPAQCGLLVQVNPDAMPGNDAGAACSTITMGQCCRAFLSFGTRPSTIIVCKVNRIIDAVRKLIMGESL